MKLYYLTGACSLASYISLIEAGQKFEAYAVDRGTRRTADGKDFNSISPKGYVPVLELDDGTRLTENVAVLTYISTLDASGKLGPKLGSMECFRILEWLAFINSEIHKNLSTLFRPTSTEDMKRLAREAALLRYGYVEQTLGDKPFLTGNDFTVADAYLYVTLSWRNRLGVDISGLPKLSAFYERCHARPSVQRARKEEGSSP
ncbi:MAG TPA: glutathione binding-like protein [Steroidobacteraceae bacterium]|nr:glutathione binding-like protein [Steroidobacteraceae bacterium]